MGLAAGEVVYADTEGWEACRPLYAARWQLAGKPDYILRTGGVVIPVETKPGRCAERPYEGDVLQLAAYCLLLEETEGRPPPHGLLCYRERTFRIPYDGALRERVVAVLTEMRRGLNAGPLPRSHDDPVRCRHCGQRTVCDQALADGR